MVGEEKKSCAVSIISLDEIQHVEDFPKVVDSSFPYTLELKGQPDEIRDYLEGLYNTIVVKDIVSRKKITDPMMLKNVLRFVFDNIGQGVSWRMWYIWNYSAGDMMYICASVFPDFFLRTQSL